MSDAKKSFDTWISKQEELAFCNEFQLAEVSYNAGWEEALAWKSSQDDWRPIKTAPKDGSYILLLDSDYVVTGHWWEPYNCWAPKVLCIDKPTHWIPLLPPPQSGEKEGE